MNGVVYSGWTKLAGDFPPSVNTTDDITALKPFESPSCYGVDCQRDGLLKTGSILSGTSRVATTKSVGGNTYYWHYDRMWRISTNDLVYGAKFYDDVYVIQGRGKVTPEATPIAFMPCLQNKMWIATASGSQFIDGADAPGGQFRLNQLIQEMTLSSGKATSAVVLDEIPLLVNTKGIFSYDGSAVKEWTRPVRYSLGSFGSEVALTCDYQQKFVIGAAKFVVDATNGKLFDYGTSGFMFTTRTLAGDGYRPFKIGDIRFSYQFSPTDASDAVIGWQSKTEDDDWFDEENINISAVDGAKTEVITRSQNPVNTVHKYAIRLTSLSSNLYIRQIDISVAGMAIGATSE